MSISTRIRLHSLRYSFETGPVTRPLTIGRRPDCDWVIPHPSVNTLQAEILLQGESWILRNVADPEAVLVDDLPADRPVRLTNGARVRVGIVEFRVEIERGTEPADSPAVLICPRCSAPIPASMECQNCREADAAAERNSAPPPSAPPRRLPAWLSARRLSAWLAARRLPRMPAMPAALRQGLAWSAAAGALAVVVLAVVHFTQRPPEPDPIYDLEDLFDDEPGMERPAEHPVSAVPPPNPQFPPPPAVEARPQKPTPDGTERVEKPSVVEPPAPEPAANPVAEPPPTPAPPTIGKPQWISIEAAWGAVRLAWEDDPETNVPLLGYVVYRRDTEAGQRVRLTPRPISGKRYVDDTVKPEREYRYAVAAVALDASPELPPDKIRVGDERRVVSRPDTLLELRGAMNLPASPGATPAAAGNVLVKKCFRGLWKSRSFMVRKGDRIGRDDFATELEVTSIAREKNEARRGLFWVLRARGRGGREHVLELVTPGSATGSGAARRISRDPAVLAGLGWLARHQEADGGWSAEGYPARCGYPAGGACTGVGTPDHDAGLTALAVLAFLGAGYTDMSNDICEGVNMADVVDRGVHRLAGLLDDEGCAGDRRGARYLYSHAIATLALCEAVHHGADEIVRKAAQRAVDFLVASQNAGWGWRYTARCGDSDTTVTGWCTQALKSAERTGLRVPPETWKGVRRWFTVMTNDAGRTAYGGIGVKPSIVPGRHDSFAPHDTSTAVGVVAHCLLDRNREDTRLKMALGHLCIDQPRWERHWVDYYHFHHATAAVYLLDGPGGWTWEHWERTIRKALVPNQRQTTECPGGSWEPLDRWGRDGGRVYATAMNVMTLETARRFKGWLEPVSPRTEPQAVVRPRTSKWHWAACRGCGGDGRVAGRKLVIGRGPASGYTATQVTCPTCRGSGRSLVKRRD